MELNGNAETQKCSTVYRCDICCYDSVRKSDYDKHILTAKHKTALNGNEKYAKCSTVYRCEICCYKTVRKTNYDKHKMTAKHKLEMSIQESSTVCRCKICDKVYKTSSGLWRHNKTCLINSVIHESSPVLEEPSDKQLIQTLLTQCAEQSKQSAEQTRMNAELHNKVLELCKNGIINNSNNTTTNNNSHNKTFNLNFFLNETCKDAVNLEDFIKSVVLQLSDIVKIGEVGFVDGMSDIIETKLNSLGNHKRPIHCTDAKREVFYVKDNDKWGKDENKKKMRALIKRMDRKLAPLLITFNNNHANKGYSSDSEHNKHQQMIIEMVGGKNGEDENEDAIIRSISRKTLIEK